MELSWAATTVVGQAVGFVGWLFLIILTARLVFEYVFMFARELQPSGFLLIVVEIVYSVTDPPLKALRRILPPLRIGNVGIDLAFTVLGLIVLLLVFVVAPNL